MIKIDHNLKSNQLEAKIARLWDLAGQKILTLDENYQPAHGTPVFTVQGKYTSRGWTEWTQGFQFGAALLLFDATGEPKFLDIGRNRTVELMAPHLTHFGVHDHGFNNVSTYGNLLRLMNERKISENPWERAFYQLALKCSGAIQAKRWTRIHNGRGYIYSFNGPHSLFADTIRSLRVLAVSYRLGHVLMDENDRRISLLERLVQHAETTAAYSVFYGEGRDGYDVRGRVAHESIFNLNDGNFRCPNSQQGYSPFSTWTRGLAWIICGYPEQLEFIGRLKDEALAPLGGRPAIEGFMRKAAQATCDFYLEHTPTDGIPYWDTGAPGLHRLGDYLGRAAEPFNDFEPVDSSAAAIAAQGLLRLGNYLKENGDQANGARYWQAGLTVLATLLDEPYLSTNRNHQGIILHSVYHRPNGWDYVPPGRKIPCGESSMWGDYHALEAALYVHKIIRNEPYLAFWGCLEKMNG